MTTLTLNEALNQITPGIRECHCTGMGSLGCDRDAAAQPWKTAADHYPDCRYDRYAAGKA